MFIAPLSQYGADVLSLLLVCPKKMVEGCVTDSAQSRQYIKRRRVPRREFKKKVGLLIRGEYHVNFATQIGEGGMMVHSEQDMVLGQRLVVIFKLPNSEETVVRAIVRYEVDKPSSMGKSYGIEFENLEFKMRREIRNYVASKSEAEYERAG